MEEAFDHVAHDVGIMELSDDAPLADEFKSMLIDWYF